MTWRDWIERTTYRWETVTAELRLALCSDRERTGTSAPPLDLDELEDRVLLSATPLPVEIVDVPDQAENDTTWAMQETADAATLADAFDSLSRRAFDQNAASSKNAASSHSPTEVPDEVGTGDDASTTSGEVDRLLSALDDDSLPATPGRQSEKGDTAESGRRHTSFDRFVPGSPAIEEIPVAARHEIVFINAEVADADRLVDDLRRRSNESTQFDVVLLDWRSDGVQQVTRALESQNQVEYDAVHILSHGSSAGVRIGGTWLTADRFSIFAAEIGQWRNAMTANADLLIYGCDLASSDDGLALLDALSATCDCDVAASVDDTGQLDLGGNWDLEYEVGVVESGVAFSQQAQGEFRGLLATFTVTNTADSGGGSFRQAIIDANGAPGTDTIDFSIGSGPQTITPTSALPFISGTVVIDGTTQPGFSGTPIIELNGASAGASSIGINFLSSGSTVQGLVINRFTSYGVALNASTGGHTVVGNYIGTDITGLIDLGNAHGVSSLFSTGGNTIGGVTAALRNVISGNDGIGVGLVDGDSNVVIGNYIGVGADGTTALGNDRGVYISNSNNHIVGGAAAGAANIIANSTSQGIDVAGGTGHQFVQNSIYGNGGLGIDLGTAGVTANDAGDGDTGANNLQNFPVLSHAATGGTQTNITGTFNGAAASTFTLEFFSSPSADPSGNGEGEVYLGSDTINTDGSGNATVNTTLGVGVTAGDVVSATATDASNNTSEFSNAVTVFQGLVVTTTSDAENGTTTSIDALLANDGGDGVSLREAIIAANNTGNIGGPDEVQFNIAGAGPHTINVLSSLPSIVEAIVVDGSTEPDYVAGTPVVELNGAAAGAVDGLTLNAGSSSSTIRGLIINRFGDDGIDIDAASASNTIVGNWIGLDNTGTSNSGNAGDGVEVQSANNIIGGTTVADRNVLSGNTGRGIHVLSATATGNTILGNYAGTNAAGTALVGNTNDGVALRNGANANTVGGLAAGFRNILSGNNQGVRIDGVGSDNNVVIGNYVGTDVTGLVDLGNVDEGIEVANSAAGTIIGGTTAAARNVIAGNADDGIQLGTLVTNTIIQGNYIGVGADGVTAIGHDSDGIEILGGSTNNTIGGTAAGAGNVIANNVLRGVRISDAGSTGNSLLGNVIHSNSTIGIDLAGDNVTANDVGDGDSGANGLQNFPVLTSVLTNASDSVTIIGALNSNTSTTYRVEFFANTAADPSGNGEAERFLGSQSVTTDGSGNAIIGAVFSDSVAAGEIITGTATVDLGGGNFGDTSEFGSNIVASMNTISTNSSSSSLTTGASSLTWSHTVASGSDRVLIVGLSVEDTGDTVTSVTYGGTPLSLLGTRVGNQTVEMWSLVAPAVGSANVVANFSGTAQVVGGAASFNGVHQSTPTGTFQSTGGSSTTPSLAVTSALGELVIGTLVANDSPATVTLGPDQLEQWSQATGAGGGNTRGAGSTEAGAASVTLSYGLSSSVEWEISAVSLKPAASLSLVVDTTSDVADGNTGSISLLLANKGADGFISLREAITAANNTANGGSPDEIHFNIAGAGPHTIVVGVGGLPSVSDAVVIDGTTEPDFAGTPIIELDGSSAGATIDGIQLAIGSDGSAIRGLVINRFGADGIDTNSDNHTITGNYLGTNVAGTVDLGNSGSGIVLRQNASGNTLGGTAVGERNVISGNDGNGVFLTGPAVTANAIVGNYIGVDAAGTGPLGNTSSGIHLASGANANTLGGTAAGAGNVIGDNQNGIFIDFSTSTNNVVQGNFIGTDNSGSLNFGNAANGVALNSSVSGTLIGGIAAGATNTIAFNAGDGVFVLSSATSNSVLGNNIYSNSGLGIDLNNDGVTSNDLEDVDAGANQLLNFPVLTNVFQNGANLDIDLEVDLPAGNYRIEFFDNAALDASTFGEGESLVASYSLTATGAAGYEAFSTTLTGVTASDVANITVTATEDLGGGNYGSTSEFGPKFQGAGVITVTSTSDVSDGEVSSIAALLGNRGADGVISLREAILATNNTVNGGSPDEIHFDIAGAGPHTITVGAGGLPNISDAVVIDGTTEPDFAGTPVVELDGSVAGLFDGLRLIAGSDSSTIRSLVINGFGDDGIEINGSNNNTIVGNYIGTDSTGLVAQANDGGIIIQTGASGNTIGGATAADRNVIAGNADTGIEIIGNTTSGNDLRNNYIGVDATGLTVLPNATDGVFINDAPATTIGGLGIGNVIAGNGDDAIEVFGANATGTVILGNFIGTDAGATLNLGNADEGILIDTTSGIQIGGVGAGLGNTIRFSTTAGIVVRASIGIDIRGNMILDNGALGIDLADDGVTTNDVGDADVGANNLQNFPVLSGAASSGGDTTITGTLNSSASTTFDIHFYSSPSGDGSGFGEGGVYLGTDSVTTDGSGNATINTTLIGVTVASGHAVTATATDPSNNTSEFSGLVTAVSNILVVDTDSDVTDGDTSSIANLATTKGADGFISLREAILAANNTANGGTPDEIRFNIAGAGPHTIQPTTSLPDITEAVIIDGTTEPDFVTRPVVELEGSLAGLNDDGLRLVAGSSGSTIRGIAITNFLRDGLVIDQSDGNVIVGNYLGVDTDGITAAGNSRGVFVNNGDNNRVGGTGATDRNLVSGNFNEGIVFAFGSTLNIVQGNYIGVAEDGNTAMGNLVSGIVLAGASNNTIGGTAAGAGNVISSSGGPGVDLNSATGNSIAGNYIGTDATGTADRGNAFSGVHLHNGSSNNTVGGITAAERNVISGNDRSGVYLQDATTTGNLVRFNYIGTSASGLSSIGNSDEGVTIDNAANNTIGGTLAGIPLPNLISGNILDGVAISGPTATSNIVQSNLIGIDALGTSALANGRRGVEVRNGATNNQIGGTATSERNVISGNVSDGIGINGVGTDGNIVYGNFIGVDLAGTTNIANGLDGIVITTGPANNTIGGTAVGSGNLIVGNSTNGVTFTGSAGLGNSVLGNQIYGNSGLGIDLGDDGVTPNDVGDGDAGANSLLNFPVLTSAITNGSTITIQGTFNSAASTTYRLEFFASLVADGSGYGEAERYLGFVNVATDGTGNATFSLVLAATVASGESISGTATDPGGNTSEFALNVLAVSPPVLDLDSDNSAGAGGADFVAAFIEDLGPIAIADVDASLTDADSSTLNSLLVTITNLQDGVAEVLSADTTGTGIAAGYAGGVLTLSGSETVVRYQQVLRTVRYDNSSQDPDATSRVITFIANDGTNNGNVAITTVSVAPVNDIPIVADDAFVTNAGSSVSQVAPGVLVNDSDPDGSLSAVLVSGPANGILILNTDGSFDYTPNAGFVGSDSFVYQAIDGLGGMATGTATLTVQSTSGPPPGDGPDDGGPGDGIPPITIPDESPDDDGSDGDSNDDSADVDSDEGDSSIPDESDDADNESDGPIANERIARRRNELPVGAEFETQLEEMLEILAAAPKSNKARHQLDSFNDLGADAAGESVNDQFSDGRLDVSVFRQFEDAVAQGNLWTQFDAVRSVAEESFVGWTPISVGSAVVWSVSAGYVMWALRSGYVLVGLASSTPAWSHFDPLPVLNAPVNTHASDSDDDESLHEIIARGN